MNKAYLTQERFDELKKELEMLRSDKRMEVAEHLKRAKEYGDLSENSEYAEAREEQSRVETRIAELDDMLKSAVIIKKTGGDVVQVGSTINVQKDGETMRYTIVGSNESNPKENKISNESPMGRAFLGHKVGESVNVETPGGTRVYLIRSIE